MRSGLFTKRDIESASIESGIYLEGRHFISFRPPSEAITAQRTAQLSRERHGCSQGPSSHAGCRLLILLLFLLLLSILLLLPFSLPVLTLLLFLSYPLLPAPLLNLLPLSVSFGLLVGRTTPRLSLRFSCGPPMRTLPTSEHGPHTARRVVRAYADIRCRRRGGAAEPYLGEAVQHRGRMPAWPPLVESR
eukprot:748996-Hanusia_phi.AAC.4